MAKATFPDTAASTGASLAPPVPRAQMQEDVCTVLLTYVRQIEQFMGRDDGLPTQAQMLGLPPAITSADGLHDPEVPASTLGLNYDMVRETTFAQVMEQLYALAYEGLIDRGLDLFDFESDAAWCSLVLVGMQRSRWLDVYGEYSACRPAVERCASIMQLAHARLVLDGMDSPFLGWDGNAGDRLTFRQMALLSGMTEASVRAMTTPSRKHALKTVSDGRSTYVTREDATVWLKAKGLYVELRRSSQAGNEDRLQKPFGSQSDLVWFLNQRLQFLDGRDPVAGALQRKVQALLASPPNPGGGFSLTEAQLTDEGLLKALARLLELDEDLLLLRIQELRLRTAAELLQQRIAEALGRTR